MPHTPKKTVNMKVPPQMVGELQNYLAQLQVQHEAEAACSNMAVEESESEPEMCEVRRVQHHKISTAGQWSFLVNFTDGSKEWVDDVKCHLCSQDQRVHAGEGYHGAFGLPSFNQGAGFPVPRLVWIHRI